MLKAALIGFYNTWNGENVWDIIKKISGFGYKALENGQFLLKGDVNKNLKKLADMNFAVLSVATDIDGLQNKLDDIISKAKAIKVKNVVCYWSDPQSFDEAVEIAKIFDKAGAKLREADLYLCYHNHDHEFKKSFNGVKYFDILMTETSPENLFLDLDVGWSTVGGEDSVALVNRLGGRIRMLHFKDFYDLSDRNSFTSLGTGKVKIQDLIVAADKLDIEYITVEQDTLRNLNCDDTVLLSYLTLKESGLVE